MSLESCFPSCFPLGIRSQNALDQLCSLEPEALNAVDSQALAAALPRDAFALVKGEASYPDFLTDLGEEAPQVLAGLGNTEVLSHERFVSIVGSRDADENRCRTTRRIAETLAASGFVIVSGLAAGIDRAAHLGAFDAENGRTIAVLGTPLCRPYPPENAELAAAIADGRGLLLSETAQLAGLTACEAERTAALRRRNRIVAALGHGTLVMAARSGSSTLIEARAGLSIGRPVLIWHEAAADAKARGEDWPEALMRLAESAAASDADPLVSIVDSAQAVFERLSPWQSVWWL